MAPSANAQLCSTNRNHGDAHLTSKPRSKKKELVNAIGFAMSRWQDAVETFDGTVAEIYVLSAAERRCLGAISHGPRPANVVARETNLTPAAVTTLIDRLEKRGFVSRQPDPNDRRKVMVAAGKKTEELVRRCYHPIPEAGDALLEKYSVAEMQVLLGFIEEVEAMHKAQTERLRGKAKPVP
ncbi:MarR family transcriptional regulator [Mesorhizobium sp. C386A]|uniref:MarR family winged helix-turn-helix transcriptional regulator n=2 Tax=Mesorhizobium TaxID=68287 RepID=UPI000A05B3E6